MVLKQATIDFWELASTYSIRLWLPFVHTKSKYPLSRINDFIETIESGSRPKGGISDIDEGAISLGGEQINPEGFVDLSNTPLVPIEFYYDSKKGKVKKNDILICKDGALTGKACFVDIDFPIKEVMINEHVYRIRSNSDIANQKFFFYLISNDFVQRQIKDLAYRKKGQPGLNLDHLKQIKIPLIPKTIQDTIVSEILPIEQTIRSLKKQIKQPQVAINKVFAREFRFDLSAVYAFEGIKFFNISDDVGYRNEQIRSSYRWHKLQEVQQVLYKNNPHIQKLGKHIKSTQNGWSPNCNSTDSRYAVFGIDALSEDTVIKFDNLKYTNETRPNVRDFMVKEGDFLVSRGNTVDLVALASIVDFPEQEIDIIFPDLLIRVDFDKTAINIRYIAYLFNSIIGRLYFKYSAKGKNQTMVKISSAELNNFHLPLPALPLQEKVVDEIKEELDKEEVVKQKIKAERNKIGELIERAIKIS